MCQIFCNFPTRAQSLTVPQVLGQHTCKKPINNKYTRLLDLFVGSTVNVSYLSFVRARFSTLKLSRHFIAFEFINMIKGDIKSRSA